MSKRTLGAACVIAVAALAVAGCGDDGDSAEDAIRRTATSVADRVEGATQLKATLSGTQEVPGPGDPDGTGTAKVNLDVTKRDVCYEVKVENIERPDKMHIHEGASGKAGDIVVPLATATGGDATTTGCANVDAALIGRMASNPGDFYVNVHTEDYPNGAVRGQLSQ
jgi:carbon monoxide dehydrogenase subunit G